MTFYNGSGQSSVSEGERSKPHRSSFQCVDDVDIVDVRVGVGRLLLEILIAGNNLGEIDGGRGDGKPEAEAVKDR